MGGGPGGTIVSADSCCMRSSRVSASSREISLASALAMGWMAQASKVRVLVADGGCTKYGARL